MRRVVIGIALLSAGLVGCGQTPRPRLPSADASQLIAMTRKIAGENACGQSQDIPKLQAQALRLINERRVPEALQEPLLSGVQALAAQTPVCLPTAPVAAPPAPPKPHGHFGPGPGHHHHGHGHDGGDEQ
jgi:hypothetical protein